jgi:hypothetical protein
MIMVEKKTSERTKVVAINQKITLTTIVAILHGYIIIYRYSAISIAISGIDITVRIILNAFKLYFLLLILREQRRSDSRS